jgi:host factor-I protein
MEKSSPQNIQDAFLNTARREKQDVVFQLSDGNSISGRIKSFDKFSVLLDIDGNDILLFKHAITTVSVEKKKAEFRVTYLGRKTDHT